MIPAKLTSQQLAECTCGKDELLLVDYQAHKLHKDIIDDFMQLQNAARDAGFALTIASSFRNFERQALIWNAKFNGHRPVLNKQQQPVDLASMTDIEKCHAIMLYSALPGSSRHHFGTDLDIFDKASVSDDYQLQLEPHEYQDNGPFAALTKWLDSHLEKYGFYRPYQHDLGGVAPEPWHISHIVQSDILQQHQSLTVLADTINNSQLAGKAAILANLPQLYQRYVLNVSPAVV
ncbi:M15 family metallopeptidase [Pseudoalteromonas rhizosphaerae]|uniref:M15 family metallopeptidase n=1 Tax=Pseudoalteromonas rhizosphaerae TaxID=2518973 RepID=UPI003850DC50